MHLELERKNAVGHRQQVVAMEIQAQLEDLKNCVENAERVVRRAERRAEQAEELMKCERAKAAKAITDVLRGTVNDVGELDSMQQMVIDDAKQHMPASQSSNGPDNEMPTHRSGRPRPSVHSRARFQWEHTDVSVLDNMTDNPETPGTRTTKSPQVGCFLLFALTRSS